jgi:hypothetical protein
MNVNDSRRGNGGGIAFGSALIMAGAIFLMQKFGLVWVHIYELWPIALIAVGLEGLFNSRRGLNR